MEQIDNPLTVIAYVTGTVLGGLSGVWIHKYFWEEEVCRKK
jgi:hypothetical protein